MNSTMRRCPTKRAQMKWEVKSGQAAADKRQIK